MILTIVWIGVNVFASPNDNIEFNDPVLKEEKISSDKESAELLNKTYNLSDVPEKPKSKKEAPKDPFVYRFTEELIPHLGFAIDKDVVDARSLSEIKYLLGLHYFFSNTTKRYWGLSFQIQNNGLGNFSLSRKWVFDHKNSTRLFYRGGININIDPDFEYGGLVDFNKYEALFSFGINDWMNKSRSFHLESIVTFGAERYAVMFLIGYSFGWL